MTLRDRVAQLVMVPCYGEFPNVRSRAYRNYVRAVTEWKVGGLIVLNRTRYGIVQRADPYTLAAFLNRMQKLAKVPLLVGGDFERGASMRVTNTAAFPHLMAFGAANDLDLTRALGRVTAREARALGVHWVYAPVADVNNNPDNPIINIRSFGENPDLVSAHVKAFIEGARSDPRHPILLSAKHFPGHGDTATDSHIGLATIGADRARLDTVELPPFRAAIEARVDSIMPSHLAVPALEPDNIPATVSKRIVTGLLREEMGFQGLVCTDAMDMQGLTKMFPPGEAAVRALEAGVDLLLIPTDPAAAINAVVNAVKQGRLTEHRINESLARVLAAKVKVGLNKSRQVNIDNIMEAIDTPEDGDLALQVAGRALSLVKNEEQAVPVARDASTCWVTLSGSRLSTAGRDLLDEVRERVPQARTFPLDPQIPTAELDRVASDLNSCGKIVLATFVAASAYRGSVGLTGNYPAFVDKVLQGKSPVIFVSFGNPYLLRNYPSVAAYMATYSTASSIETAAARALFGEIPATATPPVTIR